MNFYRFYMIYTVWYPLELMGIMSQIMERISDQIS